MITILIEILKGHLNCFCHSCDAYPLHKTYIDDKLIIRRQTIDMAALNCSRAVSKVIISISCFDSILESFQSVFLSVES